VRNVTRFCMCLLNSVPLKTLLSCPLAGLFLKCTYQQTGFEPAMPVGGWSETVLDLHRPTTTTGLFVSTRSNRHFFSHLVFCLCKKCIWLYKCPVSICWRRYRCWERNRIALPVCPSIRLHEWNHPKTTKWIFVNFNITVIKFSIVWSSG